MTSTVRSRHVRRLAATFVATLGATAAVSVGSPVASAIGFQGIPQFVATEAGDSQTRTVTVGDAAEAWYIASPIDLCATPIGGCLPGKPLLISPFPADTLHVGVVLGQETFRAYLRPDLSKLPRGADRLAGTMTLPVAGSPSDGTLLADSAAIKGCLVLKPFADGIAGSTAAPPPTDCKTSSALKYDAGKSAFTLNLTPFLRAWGAGKPELGIALVPDAAATDVWQVAINARKRPGVKHVASTIRVSIAADAPTATPSPEATAEVTPQEAPPVPSLPPVGTTPDVGPAPVLAQSPVARVERGYSGFQYPAAFWIPLGLLGLAMFLVRLFTRDLTPHRR
jgi:hypothetical protein